jgi:hypothetical protein
MLWVEPLTPELRARTALLCQRILTATAKPSVSMSALSCSQCRYVPVRGNRQSVYGRGAIVALLLAERQRADATVPGSG